MGRGNVRGIGQGLHGDLTTTGAVCISSLPNANQGGRSVLRLGDTTTRCPACGKDGVIVESLPSVRWMGIATVLDGAVIHCGCPAGSNRLIAPSETVSRQTAKQMSEPAPSELSNRSAAPEPTSLAPSSNTSQVVSSSVVPQEPGFYVVPKSMSRQVLESLLFPQQDPAVISKFRTLNPGRGDVKAGSMIVLSDPNNFQCTREESLLMEAAAHTNEAMEPLNAEEADFMHRHRKDIQDFLDLGSKTIGAGEAILARNVGDLKSTLQAIETLHQKAFLKDGHLRSPDFFSERKRLLTQLDNHLTSFVRKGIGLPDHPNLKSALGISSRSLVHRWTLAGAPGQMPGFATHAQGLAKAAKVIKYGGWVGTAVGGGA